jgi:hypothetical protein
MSGTNWYKKLTTIPRSTNKDGENMISVEQLISRVWELESKYNDLQDKYHLLIHQYEELKAKYEQANRDRHRNSDESPYDTLGNH